MQFRDILFSRGFEVALFSRNNWKVGELKFDQKNKYLYLYVYRKSAHHLWAFDQDNNDLHSQIKSNHQTIGMRILTGYFSLEGRQAHTKKIEVKKWKEREEKQDSFSPGQLLITFW